MTATATPPTAQDVSVERQPADPVLAENIEYGRQIIRAFAVTAVAGTASGMSAIVGIALKLAGADDAGGWLLIVASLLLVVAFTGLGDEARHRLKLR